MSGDDVCVGAGYQQAFLVKVGAVDKDLVVNAIGVCSGWRGEKPQQLEPAGQSASSYPKAFSEMVCGFPERIQSIKILKCRISLVCTRVLIDETLH